MSKRALVVVAHGCEDVETVAPIDVLTRVGVEVVLASLESGPVSAAYGSTLMPDCSLDEVASNFDGIVIPGGKANAKALAQSEQLRMMVREYYESSKVVAAICAAPSHVLGESAGILEGKHVTGDPGFRDKLVEHGAIPTDEHVSIDGTIITGDGPGAALSFSLSVASALVGSDKVTPFAEKWGQSFIS